MYERFLDGKTVRPGRFPAIFDNAPVLVSSLYAKPLEIPEGFVVITAVESVGYESSHSRRALE